MASEERSYEEGSRHTVQGVRKTQEIITVSETRWKQELEMPLEKLEGNKRQNILEWSSNDRPATSNRGALHCEPNMANKNGHTGVAA